jgi:hypothetical protein
MRMLACARQAGPLDEGVTARLLALREEDPDGPVRAAARRALGLEPVRVYNPNYAEARPD